MNRFEARRAHEDNIVWLLARLPEEVLRSNRKMPKHILDAAIEVRRATPASEREDAVEVRKGVYHYSTRRAVSKQTVEPAASEQERIAAQRRVQAALISVLQ